jgi:FKBP-type peptidyl-prolyl cis-trans isomerase SlyD
MIILGQSIADKKAVTLTYTLKASDGQVLDQAGRDQPFVYMHGMGQIVPGLENALTGLKVGDKKEVVVSPEEGYGDVDEALMIRVNRSQFPEGADIQPGMRFQANSPQGDMVVFTVIETDDQFVSVDGNHPLAGETLHFSVEVIAVRDATKVLIFSLE